MKYSSRGVKDWVPQRRAFGVYRLEQQLFRSSGAFELFSPSIKFLVRELTTGVALTENR